MKRFVAIAVITASLPALTGCTALEGTLAGAGLGAGTGAIVGSASHNAGAGTAIGAGIGALTGLLVGSTLENQQKQIDAQKPVVVAVPSGPAGQVVVGCPQCAQHVDVSDFAAGSKVRCPVCNTIFTF
ncbi:MAG TPA: glycine zipper domain-containing protein [bacterium]|nr:glycine zipper domain-containing protein [bacterium]